jgi:putative transposase
MDGGIYHVLNRGNSKQVVFLKDQDYQSFLDLMRESLKDFSLDLYAYCLMPNHFHFILRCRKAEDLSPWMQWLMTSHVRRYHKHYGGSGHVWQGCFKSFLIQGDEYLLSVLRYVEANPLRAGLVSVAHEWEWSSHRERLEIVPGDLLGNPPIEMPQRWSEWVNRVAVKGELDAIRRSVNRQNPYGDSDWQKMIIRKFGLESTVRPRGRPMAS